MADHRATLPEAELKSKDLGREIAKLLPHGWGFCLILFTFGDGGFMTYLSNAQRASMKQALQELLVRLDDVKPPGTLEDLV
jgi:hypothetical protein